MSIFEIIVILALGYFIGHVHTLFKIKKLLLDVAEEAGIDMEEEKKPESKVKKLEVERIDNMLYLYERDTHDFICQATTLDDLAKFAQQYKNINFATVIHDQKVFMFVNGNSKEYAG